MLTCDFNEDTSARRLWSRGARSPTRRLPDQRQHPTGRRNRHGRPARRRSAPDRVRPHHPFAPRPLRGARVSDRDACLLSTVVNALQTSIFNNVAWPDFAVIPHADTPIMKYRNLIEGVEQRVGDLWVTPVSVNHAVPTAGFIVHDGNAGVVFSGDTGPTDELWKTARELRGIKAMAIECAFPNRLHELADIAGHLTPELIRKELPKLPKDAPVWIYHVKPQFYDEIASELRRVDPDRITIVEQDKIYTL